MKENDWNECMECNSAVKITIDTSKATSLITMAEGRINYLKNQTLNETSVNYIFEGFYTSMTELVHALSMLEGYKILNHVCLGFFIRDFLKKETLFREFDDCRYKRNSLVYYGRGMDFETARDSIHKAEKIIKTLQTIIKEK